MYKIFPKNCSFTNIWYMECGTYWQLMCGTFIVFVQGGAENLVLVHVSLALEGKLTYCHVIYFFNCTCDEHVYIVVVACS